jgi:hypothetical protein
MPPLLGAFLHHMRHSLERSSQHYEGRKVDRLRLSGADRLKHGDVLEAYASQSRAYMRIGESKEPELDLLFSNRVCWDRPPNRGTCTFGEAHDPCFESAMRRRRKAGSCQKCTLLSSRTHWLNRLSSIEMGSRDEMHPDRPPRPVKLRLQEGGQSINSSNPFTPLNSKLALHQSLVVSNQQ